MDNFKREEIDRAVLQFLYVSVSKPKSKSKGTGFNDIKRAIGKGPETTSHSIKRLTNDKFVIKRGKYYYLSRSGEQLANGERSDFPSYKRVSQTRKTKRKIRDGVIRYWMRRKAGDQNKRDRELKRRLTFLVLWLAGNGVTFETVRSKIKEFHTKAIKITPSTKMTEILLNQIISPRPHTKANGVLLDTAKGVKINDFFSKHTVSLIKYSHLHEFQFERSEIEKCIKELESQRILELKTVYNPYPKLRRNEKRYQITDPMLQNLIEDLTNSLGDVIERKGLEWQRRDPSKDELNWLGFMFSNHTIKNIRSYYREVRKALEGKQQDKDLEKTILIMINFDRNPAELIRSADKKISEIWQNILTKYHDVKDKYPYDLMLGHIHPQL